jgi:cytochrome c oxidase subunit 2
MRILAVVIWIIAVVIIGLFLRPDWWLPASIATHSRAIDHQFKLTLLVIGIGFFLAHVALGVTIWRSRVFGNKSQAFSPGNWRIEVAWTLIVATIFIALAVTGQRLWDRLRLNQPPSGAIRIEVTGQQFVWHFRYPGVDGRFGTIDPKLYNDADNSIGARPGPLGIDPRDPAGEDDVVSSSLVVPAGRSVNLILRSKDVIHNFFVPALRLKHDAVPGMIINIHFEALKEGRYEIACAELCGLLHHQMRAYLDVKSQAEYDGWYEERSRNKRK